MEKEYAAMRKNAVAPIVYILKEVCDFNGNQPSSASRKSSPDNSIPTPSKEVSEEVKSLIKSQLDAFREQAKKQASSSAAPAAPIPASTSTLTVPAATSIPVGKPAAIHSSTRYQTLEEQLSERVHSSSEEAMYLIHETIEDLPALIRQEREEAESKLQLNPASSSNSPVPSSLPFDPYASRPSSKQPETTAAAPIPVVSEEMRKKQQTIKDLATKYSSLEKTSNERLTALEKKNQELVASNLKLSQEIKGLHTEVDKSSERLKKAESELSSIISRLY